MHRKIDNLDLLLTNTLQPNCEPSRELNAELLQRGKEIKMRRAKRRPLVAAAAFAGLLVLGSTSAVAAYKYLTPVEVATKYDKDMLLAKAFESENAIVLNEQVEGEGYRFTLLGITDGKGINYYMDEQGNKVEEEESFVVLATEKADGSPMPDTSEEAYDLNRFLITPLIGGEDPRMVNLYSLQGGMSEFCKDGIAYRVISCQNLSLFADRGVYLAICHELSDLGEGYEIAEVSGTVQRKENASCLNLLFNLPLDVKKANHAEADKILQAIYQPEEEAEEDFSNSEHPYFDAFGMDVSEYEPAYVTWMDMSYPEVNQIAEEYLLEHATMIDGTMKKVSKDGDDGYPYESGDSRFAYVYDVESEHDGKWRVDSISAGDTLASIEIVAYRYESDGTITFAMFKPKTE